MATYWLLLLVELQLDLYSILEELWFTRIRTPADVKVESMCDGVRQSRGGAARTHSGVLSQTC